MKHIYILIAVIAGLFLPTMAKATPDSLFVVKNGRIFSAYEVGTDIDNITFAKKQVVAPNTIKIGDETLEIKSAMAMIQGGMVYAFFSPDEGCTTMSDFASSKAYIQVAISQDLLAEDITFSKFSTEFPEDIFSVTYCDVEKYNNDDNYEPLMFSDDDYSDYFADGTMSLSQEGENLVFSITTEPAEGGVEFGVNYNGPFTFAQQSNDYFSVDGEKSQLRAAFAEQKADGIDFYFTSGNIDNAKDLEDCYYYARLFVPTKEMDGTDIDVQGSREYELELVDNVSDLNHTQYFNAATGGAFNASGYVSVLDRGDGSYTVIVDVENLGNRSTHDLQIFFKGTPMEYDLTEPSQYTVAGGDPIDIKSAVITHDLDAELYTIYLSSKENITTLEGMADADIVITEPEDFVNDDRLHGFSGAETNAMISVTYDGDTYRQTNTGNSANPIAQGGNVKASIIGNNANIDFTVFGMTKHNGSLKGHFEGNVTRL